MGPYDGDEGSIDGEVPKLIWAYRCRKCKRVHWAVIQMADHECERYLIAGRKDGVQLYIWADPGLESARGLEAEEKEPVLA